jgi:cytochrome c553
VDGASSTQDRPSLAGQSAAAIFKQLLDFRSGARRDPFMTPIAQSLVATDLANLAVFYGRHAHPAGELGRRAQPFNFGVLRLVAEGDSSRRIAACNGCHVNGGAGPVETPVLIGQQRQYLANQLRAFRDGRRRNDIDRRMRTIAGQLSDAEIDGLAAYYQGVE